MEMDESKGRRPKKKKPRQKSAEVDMAADTYQGDAGRRRWIIIATRRPRPLQERLKCATKWKSSKGLLRFCDRSAEDEE